MSPKTNSTAVADRSLASDYWPDDPPAVKRAWRLYCSLVRQDKAEAAAHKRKKWKPSNETVWAWDEFLDAIKQAKYDGYPQWEHLDLESRRPRMFRLGDEDEDE